MELSKFIGLPTVKGVIPPSKGWKENTYYKVEASFHKYNPISEYIFYTGFLNGKNGQPGGYNQIWYGAMENHSTITDVYYMKAIGELYVQQTELADENLIPCKGVNNEKG